MKAAVCAFMSILLVHAAGAASPGDSASAHEVVLRAGKPRPALADSAPAGTASVDEIVRRAGNADSDADRLNLLKSLRALPGLDAGLAADALLLTYRQTQDKRYLAPIRSMAGIALRYAGKAAGDGTDAGTEAWCAGRMGFLKGTLAKYRLLTGDKSFDRLLSGKSSPALDGRYAGDRGTLVSALRDAALAFSYNFERYTSEVRYTDRVLRFPAVFQGEVRLSDPKFPVRSPDLELLYSTVTGDPGGCGSFPLNAVRWRTPAREIAALVTHSGPERLEAELFHFGSRSRPMGAELYMLQPGRYVWTLASGEDAFVESTVTVSGPRTELAFELPSQRVCRLTVKRSQSPL